MDIKKIGIWGGAAIVSFLVITVLVIFLFPYLNPDKASSVQQESQQAQQSSFDPSKYSLEAVDSLNTQIARLQDEVKTLRDSVTIKQVLIDSLMLELETAGTSRTSAKITAATVSEEVPAIEEATKPLLSLDEDVLAPIVDLLEEPQLISLYRDGSSRQREKLLRSLKPDKAARILKKVM